MTANLCRDDAAWFQNYPIRNYRCRHLQEDEVTPSDIELARQPGNTRLIYVRKTDGATAKVWTPSPDLLLSEEDEDRAQWVFEQAAKHVHS